MSHLEAMSLHAVARYVDGKLTPQQELRFEEHYFYCRECAHAVDLEQTKLPEPAKESWWRRLGFAMLVPASAALLGLVVFQNISVIPALQNKVAELSGLQPNTVITAHPLQLGPEEGDLIKTPSVTVELPLPVDAPESPFYRVQLLGAGRHPMTQDLPAPVGGRLSLHIASQKLGIGSYDVFVYGLAATDAKQGPQIAQYHFNTKLR